MLGLIDLPLMATKYQESVRQLVLMSEIYDLTRGLLELPELRKAPSLTWVSNSKVKVAALDSSPARLLMLGFPNILHPGQFLRAGLSDGFYRQVLADVGMDFSVTGPTQYWGDNGGSANNDKVSTWYAIYAVALEMVVNGTIESDTGWTLGTGWTFDAVNLEMDGAAGVASALEQAVGAVNGESYYVTVQLKNFTAGTLTPEIGGVSGTAIGVHSLSATQTITQLITATGTGNLKYNKSADFVGSVDNVSSTPLSFRLKAMPFCRVKTWTAGTKVIDLGTHVTPATGVGYGFATNELTGFKVLWLNGACRGEISTISANNNNNATGGTVTLNALPTGTPAQGDWFIILPATNFRWLGNIFNNPSSNIRSFLQDSNKFTPFGEAAKGVLIIGGASSVIENVAAIDPMAYEFTLVYDNASATRYVCHPEDPFYGKYVFPLDNAEFTGGTIIVPVKYCKSYFYGITVADWWYCRNYVIPAGYFG